MKATHMAVVVPIDRTEANANDIRTAVWQEAAKLLLPQLGKAYARFEPACSAWGRAVCQPYGVVLGKTEPELFLYLFGAARAYQQASIQFHMKEFLDGIEPISKNEQAGVTVYSVQVKGDGENMAPHMLWHLAMIAGELMPDCGVYFLREQQAFVDNTLEKTVLNHLNRYALCVVTLAREETK